MKKNLFLRGGVAAILASALLASCSKDGDLTAEQPKPLEEDTSYFVNINILSADALTRAEDPTVFDTGTKVENTVNSIYLIFYDKTGNRVSTTQVRKENATDSSETGNGFTDSKGSRNSFYSGVVQIDVKHGSLPPAYVMAFVNPITSLNFDINPDFESLDALSRTTRPRIMGENGNFAMSKSVYYGVDRAKVPGDKGYGEMEKIVATPLVAEATDGHKKQLFTNYNDALSALDQVDSSKNNQDNYAENESVVNIYVERYAAKVSFAFSDKYTSEKPEITLNTDIKDLNDVVLTFTPEYWAVNAYESDTYIVKSFLNEESIKTGGMGAASTLSFQELNEALGGTKSDDMPWYWNNQIEHRCYWAQTPAYYADRYPRTADDIEEQDEFPLGYYSYADMVKNADPSKLNSKAIKFEEGADLTKLTTIYARENTVSGTALQNAYEDQEASPKAAIASIVLVGHYDIKGQAALKEGEFIYIKGNTTNGYTVFKEDEMIQYFINTTIPFAEYANEVYTPIFEYEMEEGEQGDFVEGMKEKFVKYFTIKHPDKAARKNGEGTLVIDSRFVTIQINEEEIKKTEENGGTSGLYAYIGGKYVEVTSSTIDEVNNQMLFAAGTVQGYNGGKVYYTIPIQHTGYYRDSNENYKQERTANSKDFDWKQVRSGDFGLVRNHSYKIIVDNIVGLGNAIPDPTVPIVPPTDPEEYFIGARLIILNWAMVDEQHETL